MNRIHLLLVGLVLIGILYTVNRFLSNQKSVGTNAIMDATGRHNGKSKPIPFSVDVKVKDFNLKDSFDLEAFIEKVGQPDKIERGGPEIIEEFGVDDFDLYYGESFVNAGHGRVLYVKIVDDRLKLNAINTNHDAMDFYNCFERRLNYHQDTNVLINDNGASIVVVRAAFENFKSVEYYAPAL